MNIFIDVETYSSIDLTKSGAHKYVASPDFRILLLSYAYGDSPVYTVDFTRGETIPEDLFERRGFLHAFNAAFEWLCLSKHLGLTESESARFLNKWRCTMIHSAYCGCPLSLEMSGEALGLTTDKKKAAYGKTLIKTFCGPQKDGRIITPEQEPEKWELFRRYNAQDVEAERAIEAKLTQFPVPDFVWGQWTQDVLINTRGVLVDTELVSGALALDELAKAEMTLEAQELTGLSNPNSRAQLLQWALGEGELNIADLKKSTVENLLSGEISNDITRQVLELRQKLSRTSTAKYKTLENTMGADNRVRGLLQFYGANRTGRWAGRLLQIQNLVKTHLPGLDGARELVRRRDSELVELIYGDTTHALSQLIRTTLIAPEGKRLISADFSAIEARVIAWLAGEDWVLDVFRTHGKIYEATASRMYGVPIERIVRGNPEYELRQRGKTAALALGYQSGVNGLTAMDSQGLIPDEEKPAIVAQWREANPAIVQFWHNCENAAMSTLRDGRARADQRTGLVFEMAWDWSADMRFFTVKLPSGRKLYYNEPHFEKNRFGRDAFACYGMDQKTHKWGKIDMYGGKFAENCLSGDTPVLTNLGTVQLEQITLKHRLWDGERWVQHGGLIKKGYQTTVSVDGIRLTPEHLILTERGWRNAPSCSGLNRYAVALPSCNKVRRLRRQKVDVAGPLRLRERARHACERLLQGQSEIMRLRARSARWGGKHDPWEVRAPAIRRLAFNAGPLPITHTSSMAQLRRPWYSCVRSLGAKFSKFLGRHVPILQDWINARPRKQRWGLYPGELSMGKLQSADEQQTRKPAYKHSMGEPHSVRSVEQVRYWGNNASIPNPARCARAPLVCKAGRYEPVYDIRNAGPLNRFVVMGATGPLIVHNCTQSIARDILAESIDRLTRAGYEILFHVHDEIVIEVPEHDAESELKRVCDLMGEPPAWAPGLPLRAEGYVSKYYKKD
jgi:DNA polymerase